jgi:hypothetical protein
LFIDKFHKFRILEGVALWLVVNRRAINAEQLALPLYANVRVVEVDDLAPALTRAA